jgi:hypothetical protein
MKKDTTEPRKNDVYQLAKLAATFYVTNFNEEDSFNKAFHPKST